MISKKRKFVFVHIPKTGGSSVAWALRREFDRPNSLQRTIISLSDRILGCSIYPKSKFQPLPDHAKAIDYVDHLGEDYWEMNALAFVRNPFDLQVSLFNYMRQTKEHPRHTFMKGLSFRDFIHWADEQRKTTGSERTPASQTSYVLGAQNRKIVKYIGRQETLAQDFDAICSKIGVTANLGHENKSIRSGSVSDHYDRELADIVIKNFKLDFELLGYSTDPGNADISPMKLTPHPRLGS